MWAPLLVSLVISYNVGLAESGYPPMGDEVQAGSVLLPASRRGRYLANIVRRQAVDGTGIKFNKDADRMNAEAKKKVDVLSEELLPYIIAEQERRTTLYKRVMTAIQNGEKGVTIAEIRNKPPAIIRKGLMYRCPTNRAPREPDGSGVVMCEDNLDPTPIMFESCLSAEDKELYVADNKYFFCNRHKIEGPDLPRNGTTVIGCAPCERTPLNYTSQRCALEDTDDVVVHYRYYPDRTYKFVSELDPEREVCEHWNPCQVGYIFSLPGPDQATPASELWHEYEIVSPVPEDDKNETVALLTYYKASPRRVRIPEGYKYDGIGKYMMSGKPSHVSGPEQDGMEPPPPMEDIEGDPENTRRASKVHNVRVWYKKIDDLLIIEMWFVPVRQFDITTYYVRFESLSKPGSYIHVPLLTISLGQTKLKPLALNVMPSQPLNTTSVEYECEQCTLHGIMVRAQDGVVRNLELDKYYMRTTNEPSKKIIDFNFGSVKPRDFGDYFLIIQNEDGSEERIKAITMELMKIKTHRQGVLANAPLEVSVTYECSFCKLMDVMCRGVSVLDGGHVTHTLSSKRLTFTFTRFENEDACDYIGLFKNNKVQNYYRISVAVLEKVNVKNAGAVVAPPPEGSNFEHTVEWTCDGCRLLNVTVNGVMLEHTNGASRRAFATYGGIGYIILETKKVIIGVTEYNDVFEGVYQGIFALPDGVEITKNLMEIGKPDPKSPDGADEDGEPENQSTKDATTPSAEATTEEAAEEEPEAEEPTTEATEPEAEGEAEPEGEAEAEGEPEAEGEAEPEGRRAGGADKKAHVEMARDAAAAGSAYKRSVRLEQPGGGAGTLAALSCRGRALPGGAGWRVDNDTLHLAFDRFEDSNACVYVGTFKSGATEHQKTLAVIEMVKVTAAAVPAPATGPLDHSVTYTCSAAACNPEMIYINNRTLKSDDKEHFYSFKSDVAKGPQGNITTVTVHFTIAPFTKEFEGVYQVVVRVGTETITKNILEVGVVV